MALPDAVLACPEARTIGRFALEEKLGEGAFGMVFRAHDPQLDREVALKVAKPSTLTTPRRVERFFREAKAAGNLRHPHIVPVFDAGQDGSRYYIASAFIRGQTLESKLQAGPIPPKQIATLVRQLAEALGYAHALGIVHRDVKPANVMVDEQGQALLMDFGLAARQEEAEKLTQDGAIIGTPLYMAPEQARGTQAEPQPSSDQYSLGVLLYELLTGQTPFAGPPEVVLANHLQREPPPPGRVKPGVPRDLETICLKCLAKQPAERYATCQDVADDVRRWQDCEPIRARRHSLAERAWRWCKREPRLAALGTLAGLSLVAVAVVMALSAAQQAELTRVAVAAQGAAVQEAENSKRALIAEAKERDRADRESQNAKENAKRALDREAQAKQSAEHARRRLYTTTLQSAAVLSEQDHDRARQLLEDADRCPPELRDFTWHMIFRVCRRDRLTLPAHKGMIHSLAFSPDGKSLAVGSGALNRQEATTIPLYDTATWKVRTTLAGHPHTVTAVAFAPDGLTLASASLDQTVKVWDVNKALVKTTLTHSGPVFALGYSPDGKLLVSAGPTPIGDKAFVGEIKVWKTTDASLQQTLQGDKGAAFSPAFSPDGLTLAVGSESGSISLWDTRTWEKSTTLASKSRSSKTFLAFSPDGQTLIVRGNDDNGAELWSVPDGKLLRSLTDPAIGGSWAKAGNFVIRPAIFTPDGKSVLTEGWRGRMVLMDSATGEIRSILGYSDLRALAYSPDGRTLVSGSPAGRLTVWETSPSLMPEKRQARWPIARVLFSPSSEVIALTGGASEIQLLAARTGVELGFLKNAQLLAFSSDSKKLVVLNADKVAKAVQLDGGNEQVFPEAGVRLASCSPDGRVIVLATTEGLLSVWDMDTLQKKASWKAHDGEVFPLRFSLDGRKLASAGSDGFIRVWDVSSWKELASYRGEKDQSRSLDFTADGRLIALLRSRNQDKAKVVEIEGRRALADFPKLVNGNIGWMASGAGTHFAIQQQETVSVWDVKELGQSLPLRKPSLEGNVETINSTSFSGSFPALSALPLDSPSLAFAQRGNTLASMSIQSVGDRRIYGVKLWDPVTGEERFTLKGYRREVANLTFSPDSQTLAATEGQTLLLWHAGLDRWPAPGR